MPETLGLLSNRPDGQDEHSLGIDVVGEVLDAAQLTTALYGRLELGMPWHFHLASRPHLSFYVVARGGGHVRIEPPNRSAAHAHGDHTADSARDEFTIALSAGDALLLPHGSAHTFSDALHSTATTVDLDYGACPRPFVGSVARFGGSGPVTSLVTGHFLFAGSARRNPLLATLPTVIHVPANAVAASPQLAGVVPLILAESAQPGPGAQMVLARLADLLLVHALRYWISTARDEACGMHAVVNPAIGGALRLMHARANEAWTVESLAAAVSMSRSVFAARFTQLVGEPPLHYLARWRMTLASRLLTGSDESVEQIAARVGYANAVAFAKAFAKYQGVGPGGYRKAHRAA